MNDKVPATLRGEDVWEIPKNVSLAICGAMFLTLKPVAWSWDVSFTLLGLFPIAPDTGLGIASPCLQ